MPDDRPDPNTGWIVTPPTYGVSKPRLSDRPDLVVVDAQRRRHRQRHEHAARGQPLDGGVLEAADVRAPVVDRRLGRLSVVLQVDLHPLPVPRQQVQQRVVARDRQPVGVHQHAHHRPRGDRVEQLAQPRVERRLTAGEHQDVEATVLLGQPRVDRGQHLLQRRHPRTRRRGLGEAGRALEVAVVEDVLEQDAGVLGLHLRQPVLVGRRDGRKLPARSGWCTLVGAVHCSRYARISADSSYSVRTRPWSGQPRSR